MKSESHVRVINHPQSGWPWEAPSKGAWGSSWIEGVNGTFLLLILILLLLDSLGYVRRIKNKIKSKSKSKNSANNLAPDFWGKESRWNGRTYEGHTARSRGLIIELERNSAMPFLSFGRSNLFIIRKSHLQNSIASEEFRIQKLEF